MKKKGILVLAVIMSISVLSGCRKYMAVKPLDEYQEVEEQLLTAPDREGFTLVEWADVISNNYTLIEK